MKRIAVALVTAVAVFGLLNPPAGAGATERSSSSSAAALSHCPSTYGQGTIATGHSCVVQWQRALNQWRFWNGLPGIAEDGNFGGGTRLATLHFQAGRGLSQTGTVNPSTRVNMQNYTAGVCLMFGGVACGLSHF